MSDSKLALTPPSSPSGGTIKPLHVKECAPACPGFQMLAMQIAVAYPELQKESTEGVALVGALSKLALSHIILPVLYLLNLVTCGLPYVPT